MCKSVSFFALVALILMISSLPPVNADEVEVRYKTFYSHVKKLKSEDTKALQFAFGFTNIKTGKLCKINSARISTQKQQIPLVVSSENRFTIQSEKALNLADANVVLDFEEPSNICDISVQLETKPEYLKKNYSFEELRFIYEQYEAFFNEMGSFLSFMMPTVKGLMIQFEDPSLTEQVISGEQVNQGILLLDDEWFEKEGLLRLKRKPLRITAIASK
ncbi:DUF2987 domain-containing protein [Glaciecola sp. MH2013]|uniref:DUF2987 domain-containing protein n=1 Tax=Glaciecola sp. MH2013 TaxID=2785524 RepID=UPI00189DD68A|nr:DUF2987 domain-containing protein [Glaciecola sp. MH2013]MBF7072837.1 DUF2987 domain-containing protein [Glaciecola sp. MH2013]